MCGIKNGACPICGSRAALIKSNGTYFCMSCGATITADHTAALEAPKMITEEEKRLLLLNDSAQKVCRFYLENKEEAEEARKYLRTRKLKKETVKQFGLGYIGSGRYLENALKKRGFTDEELIQSGLFKKNEDGTLWCTLNKRIIFPIQNAAGYVIGFGGRVLDDSEPKYKNSPETLVYQKRMNLYGWDKARQSGKDHVILCEGYMDVIAMHQAGFTNAVASLGTALTAEQAKMLSQTVSKVITLYDTDTAGQNATRRAIDILKKNHFRILVADTLPAKDPDEFIKRFGKKAFSEKLKRAHSELNHLLLAAKNEEGEFDPDKMLDILISEDPERAARAVKNIQ